MTELGGRPSVPQCLCGSGEAGGHLPIGGPCDTPEGWGGDWGFDYPGGLPMAPQCHTEVTRPDQHQDVLQPRPTRPWWHVGGDPRGPPVPGRPGAMQGPPASPSPRVSASFRGSRSPNSLGGRQTRRLGRNRRGGGQRPNGCRPEMVPSIPGAERGAGGVGFGTQRTVQPFWDIPVLRRCGCLRTEEPAAVTAFGGSPPGPPSPGTLWGAAPPHLWAYVTSSAVSSGARLICS